MRKWSSFVKTSAIGPTMSSTDLTSAAGPATASTRG